MPIAINQDELTMTRNQLIKTFDNYRILFEKYQKTISLRKKGKQKTYLNGLELSIRNILAPYVEKDISVSDPDTISIRVMFFAQDPTQTTVLACHIIPVTPNDYQNIINKLQTQIDTGLVTVDQVPLLHHSATFDRDVLMFFKLIGKYMIDKPALIHEFIDTALIIKTRRFTIQHHQLISLIKNQSPLLINELASHQVLGQYVNVVIYETCFDFIQSLLTSYTERKSNDY